MITKVDEVGEFRDDLREVTYGYRTLDTQAVGFNKDPFLFQPGEEVVVSAFEFYIAEAAVAEHVASDAHVRLVLFFDASRRDFEEFLKSFFTCRELGRCEYDLIIVVCGT